MRLNHQILFFFLLFLSKGYAASSDACFIVSDKNPIIQDQLKSLGPLGLCSPSPGFSPLSSLHPPTSVTLYPFSISLVESVYEWSMQQKVKIPIYLSVSTKKIKNTPLSAEYSKFLLPPYNQIIHFFSSSDDTLWMQDVVEFGSNGGKSTPAVLGLLNQGNGVSGDVAHYFEKSCSMENMTDSKIYLDEPDGASSGGNIEALPGGVIATGSEIESGLEKFLERNSAQQLTKVDLSWLSVGHIDEIISLIPAQNECGFALLTPSTQMGLALLDQMPDETILEPTSGFNEIEPSPEKPNGCLSTLPDIQLGSALTAGDTRQCDEFKTVNAQLDQRIDSAIKKITSAIENKSLCKKVPVIKLPILFRPDEDAKYRDINPNPINSLVLNDTIFIPEQPNKYFKEAIEKQLEPTKIKIKFVNVNNYHFLGGHSHCASNAVRTCQENLTTLRMDTQTATDNNTSVPTTKKTKNPFAK